MSDAVAPSDVIVSLLDTARAERFYNVGEARTAAGRARVLALAAGDALYESQAVYLLASIEFNSGDSPGAMTLALDARQLAEACDNEVTVAHAEHLLAIVSFEAGDYAHSLERALLALTIYQQTSAVEDEGNMLSFVAVLYDTTKQYDLAIETYETALALSEPMNRFDTVVLTLNNLSGLLWRVGRRQDALARITRAIEIARTHTREFLPACLGELAIFQTGLGNPTVGLKLLQEAHVELANARTLGAASMDVHETRLYIVASKTAALRGAWDDSAQLGEHGLTLAADVGLVEQQMEAHSLCAEALKHLRNFERALWHREEGERLRVQLFDTAADLRTRMLQISHGSAQARLESGFLRSRVAQLESLVGEAESVGFSQRPVLALFEKLATLTESRQWGSARHVRAVAEMSAETAAALGRPEAYCDELREAARFHDVGQLAVEVASAEGFAQHTVVGAELLLMLPVPVLAFAARIARSHHERWDGTGFPDALVGADIPFEARVVSVADFYETTSSSRRHGPGLSECDALAALTAKRGIWFDPQVVDAFTSVLFQRLPAPFISPPLANTAPAGPEELPSKLSGPQADQARQLSAS